VPVLLFSLSILSKSFQLTSGLRSVEDAEQFELRHPCLCHAAT
jgi:hypothetical protein